MAVTYGMSNMHYRSTYKDSKHIGNEFQKYLINIIFYYFIVIVEDTGQHFFSHTIWLNLVCCIKLSDLHMGRPSW